MQEEDQYEHQSECEDYVDYGPDGYHPVYLGEKFNSRYVVVQKLGWGHFSTVWLVNDTKEGQYCALKIQRSKDNHAESALDQLQLCRGIMKHQNNENWHEYIQQLAGKHPNIIPHPELIRPLTLLDNFAHHGIHGKHYCSVFQLLGPNLLDVIQHYQFKEQRMPLWLVKKITIDVLLGLQYLHDYCNIIHTDLKPENIMVKMTAQEQKQFVDRVKQYKVKPISMKYLKNLESSKNSKARKKNEKKKLKKKLKKEKEQNNEEPEQIKEIEKKESFAGDSQSLSQNPGSLRIIEETGKKEEVMQEIVAESQIIEQKPENKEQGTQNDKNAEEGQKKQEEQEKKEYNIKFLKWKNVEIELTTDLFFKIVDMGNACFTHHHYTEDIQTREYRSPEVLLGYSYGPKTDIWSLGCTVFEMLTNNFLFKPKKISGISKDEDHLFRIIEVLGPISKQHALSGVHSAKFFNKKGKLLNGHPKSHVRLNQLLHEDYNYSLQDSVEIEQFLLPMLQINEEKRFSARQCLQNEWLWQ